MIDIFNTVNNDEMHAVGFESYHRKYAHSLPVSSFGYFPQKTHWLDKVWPESVVSVSFLVEGEGVLEIDDTSHRVKAPCVMVESGPHRFRYGPSGWWREYFIAYNGIPTEFFRKWHLSKSASCFWHMGNPDIVVGCLEKIYALSQNLSLDSSSDSIDHLAQMAILESRMPHQQDVSFEQSAVIAIEAHLRRNFHTAMNWERLAHKHGLSIASFHRHFKRYVHDSPARHQMKIKLEHAANRVIHTSDSLKIIGAQLGFGDLAYFSNAFKKRYGISPGEYRKKWGT